MKLWRLTQKRFLHLNGAGAELSGGRWTSPGLPVVNFASEAGLAVLVVLRYLPRDLERIDEDYFLGWTDVDHEPEDIAFEKDAAEKRRLGDAWLNSRRTLLARVQSAVLPEASIILMNPRHSAAAEIAPLKTRPFSFKKCLELPPFPS
ncbi:MAG: RES family NAD+ phosphorylase [Alteraurantiacibacter sp. bin_em_oilr2.035]|uniref:RES family NAD+ phosphorylase n=1 Tax=Aurantiacibacter atlanticus TaxID=1648404 RepID=UPI00065F3952|nr:RES family NAD+ phosphorylase [Aurantiacibacter atlanticus]MDF1834539.1 RES family NAD+ phosphorylase [Alteraurantiacibacter sp. bin_em_oilr2.035]